MYTAIVILHVIVSLSLILIILLQRGKGADIGAVFGGGASQTLFGSSGPAHFLSKMTAGVAIIFMITSLYLAYFARHHPSTTLMRGVEAGPAMPGPAAPPEMPPGAAPAGVPETPAPTPPAAPER
jgi:preprotein translocase subunit SecG